MLMLKLVQIIYEAAGLKFSRKQERNCPDLDFILDYGMPINDALNWLQRNVNKAGGSTSFQQAAPYYDSEFSLWYYLCTPAFVA